MKITITGHRPDDFLVSHYSLDTVERIADDVVCILKRQYDDLIFNIGGALGTDQIVGNVCLKYGIPYHVFLPFSMSEMTRYWKQEDKDNLQKQIDNASGIFVCEPYFNNSAYQKRNIKMVDNSAFVVSFWVGKRRGGTFNCMEYALQKSKFVFNALDDLRPIFKEDLKKGWTPPVLGDVNE